jgi:hypothetical protein
VTGRQKKKRQTQLSEVQRAVIWEWWEAFLCSVPPEAAQHKAYLDPETARTLRSASNTLAKTRKATNPPTAPILEQPTLKNLAETPKATDPPTAQANDEFPPPSTPTFQLYLKKISMERDRAGEAPIILDRGRNGSVPPPIDEQLYETNIC